MKFILGPRSLLRLHGVHPDLVRVVKRAIQITDIDFTVLEGLRTKARQIELYERGASRTLNSRHLTGHAVDLAPWVRGKVSWHWPDYDRLVPWIRAAAAMEDVAVVHGADWPTFRDGPHHELDRKVYP